MRELNYNVYALAPPLIFSSQFNEFMAPIMTSAVFGSDAIARLWLGSIQDLVRMMAFWSKLDVDKSELKARNIIKMHMLLKGPDIPAMIQLHQNIVS